jgi:hypothetical protein
VHMFRSPESLRCYVGVSGDSCMMPFDIRSAAGPLSSDPKVGPPCLPRRTQLLLPTFLTSTASVGRKELDVSCEHRTPLPLIFLPRSVLRMCPWKFIYVCGTQCWLPLYSPLPSLQTWCACQTGSTSRRSFLPDLVALRLSLSCESRNHDLSLLLTFPCATAQRPHGLAHKGCAPRRSLRVFALWFVHSLVGIVAALVTPVLGFLTALFFYACNSMLSRSHRRDGINKPMLGSACLLWALVH